MDPVIHVTMHITVNPPVLGTVLRNPYISEYICEVPDVGRQWENICSSEQLCKMTVRLW